MELAHRWSDRNLSRIELTVALLLLALLIGGFAERMIRLFAATEKRFVEATVINLNSALQVRAALASMTGDIATLRALVNESPMKQGRAAPRLDAGNEQGTVALAEDESAFMSGTYLGEWDSIAAADLPGGTWYFDRTNGILVYRVNNDEFFSGEPVLRYRVTPEFRDSNGNGEYEPDSDELLDIRLDVVGGGSWRL